MTLHDLALAVQQAQSLCLQSNTDPHDIIVVSQDYSSRSPVKTAALDTTANLLIINTNS